jgi:Zn-dependent protease with chaperone function
MQALMVALVLAAGADPQAAVKAEQAAYEAKVLAELEAVAPGALADGRAASEAYVADRWEEAIAAYQRVLQKAPRFSHALRRICNVQVQLNQFDAAVGNCRAALTAAPLPENRAALARALAHAPERPGTKAEAARLAREALSGKPDASLAIIACDVALEVDDAQLLSACVAALQAVAPASMQAHFFASLSAATHADYDLAESELKVAREAGLPAEAADKLAAAIRRARAGSPGDAASASSSEPAAADDAPSGAPLLSLPFSARVLGIWAATLVLLLALGAILSAATARAAGRLARAPAGTDSAGSRGLRSVYRAVLWVTCLFYYLSIPIVLVVVVALGAGLLWLIFQAGRVPLKLVLIIGLLVLATVWAVLKSLWASIFRPSSGDPGRRVGAGEHPELQRFVKGVATRVKTRAVDAIFLTPGAEIAVFERGGVVRQLAGRAERCLILGVGVLEGMSQGELKAVLAHEYGHFVNRDTAGGGFALAVRRSILTMARSLAQGGAATWYNPAWWFVLGFHKVFLRVSQGASRLQEILADRWAAILYGGRTFARGLEHAIAQGVRFDAHAQRALNEVIEGQRALGNLYRYVPSEAVDARKVDAAIAEAMNAEPSPYDSHPAPRDRIAWTAGVAASGAGGIDDAAPAWSLFSDREAVERAMTLQIKTTIAAKHGVKIPDEPPVASAG